MRPLQHGGGHRPVAIANTKRPDDVGQHPWPTAKDPTGSSLGAGLPAPRRHRPRLVLAPMCDATIASDRRRNAEGGHDPNRNPVLEPGLLRTVQEPGHTPEPTVHRYRNEGMGQPRPQRFAASVWPVINDVTHRPFISTTDLEVINAAGDPNVGYYPPGTRPSSWALPGMEHDDVVLWHTNEGGPPMGRRLSQS